MKLTVNGATTAIAAGDKNLTLLEWLRERLDLTGAKDGCGVGRCGACTVIVDGKATLACKTILANLNGARVLTIEGLSAPSEPLHPLQQAFVDKGAIQCGFCTPGMVLRSHAFLLAHPRPDRDGIRRALSPNLCRCTGYQQIIDAVEAASAAYAGQREQEKTT
ncbi:MAG: (2Fe-2S)-binding protein [Myxococcota bacterium]|jgi:carbon-monoxide dehydrogenase small subunit|nr:(2Fe-2S)-binding protein [Myxococcota bacterium]